MSENEIKRKIDDIEVENEAKKLAVENDQKEDIIADPAAHFVTSQYELLKRILAHLPGRQLARCARVSLAWREASRIVMKDREKKGLGKPAAFWWIQPQDLKSSSFKNNLVEKQIAEDFSQKLDDFSARVKFTPKVIIIFNTPHQGKEEYQREYIIKKKFPKAIIFGGNSFGLVGTDQSGQAFESEENRKPVAKCSLLFIPPWPGVNFTTIGLTKETPSELQSMEVPRVDAALILSPQNFLENISVTNSDVAIGGASPDTVYGEARALCMENVRCGVVLLDQNCKTESKIRKELTRLKGKFNESNGFCLMLACCGRGKYFHKGKKDVESKIFQSLFPGVPVIGFFGNGEIGFNSRNTFYEHEEFEEKLGEVNEDEIFHGFTTVFMVVSIDTTDTSSSKTH